MSLFAVALVLLALSGCRSTAPERASAAASATATTTPLPADSAPVASPAAQHAAIRRFAALRRPVYCGARHGNLVALTFDDGPGPDPRLALRVLRKAHARATFFVVGDSLRRFPRAAPPERKLAAIGDHTMTHAHLPGLPTAAAMKEVRAGREAALDAVGPPIELFRPPYGGHTKPIDDAVGAAGMVQVLWDLDSADSRVSPPAGYREISANVRRAVRPGSIVLMHENRGQTVRALRGILPGLRRRGLRAVTVPELLAADPPTRAQLAAGRDGCRWKRVARRRGRRPARPPAGPRHSAAATASAARQWRRQQLGAIDPLLR